MKLTYTGDVLVRARPGAKRPDLPGLAPLEEVAPTVDPGEEPIGRWHAFRSDVDKTSPDAIWAVVRSALRHPDVDFAEPEAVGEVPPPPDMEEVERKAAAAEVPATPLDWHLQVIGAEAAWSRSVERGARPGEGIRIGHLDTGYTAHPAAPAGGRLLVAAGRDFWDPSRTTAEDPLTGGLLCQPGHGTGTLCLLAADFVGSPAAPAYQGVALASEVLPLRVSPSVVLVATRALAKAIVYAADNGVHVLTISLGGLPSQCWADAVNYAYRRGVVMCAAAGNHFGWGPFRTPTWVVHPARFERCIAVSGITRSEGRYRSSRGMSGNDGPEVELAAPTPDVRWATASKVVGQDGVTSVSYGYAPGGGTSTATPQVAGAAALWLAYWRDSLTRFTAMERVEACRLALVTGATDAGTHPYEPVPGTIPRTRNDWFGDGRLHAARTLLQAPRRGLPPQPPADVLRGLGPGLLSGVRRSVLESEDDLAGRIELLWGIHGMNTAAPLMESLDGVVSKRLLERLW